MLEPTLFAVVAGVGLGLGLGFKLEAVDSTVIAGGWALVAVGTAILVLGVALRVWAMQAPGGTSRNSRNSGHCTISD